MRISDWSSDVCSSDLPCPHEDVDAFVEVNRVTASDTDPTVVGYHADIKVNCRDCGEPFRWTGVKAGMSQGRPMCSVDETELRAPLRPASADPACGLGLPGFPVQRPEACSVGTECVSTCRFRGSQ